MSLRFALAAADAGHRRGGRPSRVGSDGTGKSVRRGRRRRKSAVTYASCGSVGTQIAQDKPRLTSTAGARARNVAGVGTRRRLPRKPQSSGLRAARLRPHDAARERKHTRDKSDDIEGAGRDARSRGGPQSGRRPRGRGRGRAPWRCLVPSAAMRPPHAPLLAHIFAAKDISHLPLLQRARDGRRAARRARGRQPSARNSLSGLAGALERLSDKLLRQSDSDNLRVGPRCRGARASTARRPPTRARGPRASRTSASAIASRAKCECVARVAYRVEACPAGTRTLRSAGAGQKRAEGSRGDRGRSC